MAASEPVVAHRKVVSSSDRSFGLVFAAFFGLIGLWPLVHSASPRWWAVAAAAAFALAAFVAPAVLRPLNRAWLAFGMLLHAIVNPVVMAVMFYGAIVPMGLLLRALGKDLLRLKPDPAAPSYWITREPPAPGSMRKQF